MSESIDFTRLASGELTLITASNRQSRYWAQRYHYHQSQSESVWPSPTILPFNSWVRLLFQKFSKRQLAPILLSDSHALQIWEDIIRQSSHADYLISIRATAKKVVEAFQMIEQWQLDRDAITALSEDHQAFLDWQSLYLDRLQKENWLDSSQLVGWLIDQIEKQTNDPNFQSERLLSELDISAQVDFIGFHQTTPQQMALIALLETLGVTITIHQPRALQIPFNANSDESAGNDKQTERTLKDQDVNLNQEALSPKRAHTIQCTGFVAKTFDEELMAAADWLKQQVIQKPKGRFAFIIPDLEKRRFETVQRLKQQWHPESLMAHQPGEKVFNVSIGEPLTHYPMVRVARSLVNWLTRPISSVDLAEILIGQTNALFQPINGLAKELAWLLPESGKTQWSLEETIDWLTAKLAKREIPAEARQQLDDSFKTVLAFTSTLESFLSPEHWGKRFEQWLELWGWPGSFTLSSQQFQLREQFLALLNDLKQYNLLNPSVNRKTVYGWLNGMIESQAFQPKSLGEPIQVMGLYEAVGLKFDGVWLSGLSNEVMPEVANPNPFIPLDVSREHQLPGSGPERELHYAQSLMVYLVNTSDELVISYHQNDQERELSPSPIAEQYVEAWQPIQPVVSTLQQQVVAPKETFVDEFGDEYQENDLVGGSAFIHAQSLCPMQGYLQFRLRLEEQPERAVGTDPRERGVFVHKVMHRIWQTIQTQERLLGLTESELSNIVDAAILQADETRSEHRSLLKEVEKDKYRELIFSLLALETKRQSFRVVACEQAREIVVNDFVVSTRLDRLDQVNEDEYVIIDYKTGQTSHRQWFEDRMGEPQLPLYLLADKLHTSAICFAQLHHNDVKFVGVAKDEALLPSVRPFEKQKTEIDSWQTFIEHVEHQLNEITDEIRKGYAAVKPAHSLRACDYCPFDSVCRVGELESLSMESVEEQHKGGE